MKKQPRKTRRARREVSDVSSMPPLARLALIAGDSLKLNDEQLTVAMNALSGFEQPDELADALHARLLEMVELLRDLPEFAGIEIASARNQLERRRGAGFVRRVAEMGIPAADALSSHKIQGVNSARALLHSRELLALVQWKQHRNNTRGLLARRCEPRKNASSCFRGKSAGSRLRSMVGICRRTNFGRVFESSSSARLGSSQKSLSSSTVNRSTRSRSNALANRSTQSDAPRARLNTHRTRERRTRNRCGSFSGRVISSPVSDAVAAVGCS